MLASAMYFVSCVLTMTMMVVMVTTTTLFIVSTGVHAQETYTLEQLQGMSQEELEQICVVRGFQLVKDETDPESGQQYQLTHDDFVEAAQRCLAIEEEMNELLNEYPELAEELEEELKKMEEENVAKQEELAELQSRLEEQHSTEDGSATSGTGSGAAFVSSGKTPSTTTEQETTGEESDEDTLMQQGDELEDDVDSDNGQEELTITETTEDVVDETGTVVTEKDEETSSSVVGNTTDVTTKPTTTSDDFTMTHLAIETLRAFVEHAKDDVKRLVGLMIPVVQPLFNAGDVAWRQIKALFVKARDAYYTEPTEDEEGTQDSDNRKKETASAES